MKERRLGGDIRTIKVNFQYAIYGLADEMHRHARTFENGLTAHNVRVSRHKLASTS